jgi:hypothetical protein
MMRAKMQVDTVERFNVKDGVPAWETLDMSAVSDKPYDKDGMSEDSTFARYTPSGRLSLTIENPVLFGKFKPGQKFYLDFTEAQ